MLFSTQKFLVAGLSRSGIAAAEYLLDKGAEVLLFDDVEDAAVTEAAGALRARGCRMLSKEEAEGAAALCDVLVLSPGIPVDHPLPVSFRRAGKRVAGEAELGALALRCPVVAVTGTNGKTTTVSMLEHILREAGRNAVACGNIGKPIVSCVDELGETGIAVAEISSFQLETLVSLRPHVAVELNISEDHLNRHYNMENYVYLKSRLMRNLTESEYAVLSRDDPLVRTFAEKTKAQIVWFSTREKTDGGYCTDGTFFWRGEAVFSEHDLPVAGAHNREDALAAMCAAKLLGIESGAIARAIKGFRGVPHRMQTIGSLGGVTFIDDSKATNVASTQQAIASVQGESVLLIGGKDKGYSYEPLFREIKRSGVVHAVLYGENAFRLFDAARESGFDAVTLCRPFDLAVRVAFLTARRGQNVLLSPASASYDAFRDFEERGERFAALLHELSAQAEKNGAREGERETARAE